MDLNEATREVIALSRSELQRSRVTLRTELADGLPAVTGDRVQLQQVILNLLLNAAQAMNSVDDRSRRLMIRTEREGEDHVRLTVQDVGIGFDGKDVDRLFEAFYTTKTSGMGIIPLSTSTPLGAIVGELSLLLDYLKGGSSFCPDGNTHPVEVFHLQSSLSYILPDSRPKGTQ